MTESNGFGKRYGLILAVIALIAILLIPTPEGLPVAGHKALAILAFAIIVWMTEAVTYPVSATAIGALIAVLVGLAPDPEKPAQVLGTSKALGLALAGFSNTATALVGGALFLSAAMMVTGLDRRIALVILNKVGATANRILIGVILVSFVLSFFVPSSTARMAAVVPIILGIITAFKVDKRSRFAGLLMIAAAQVDSIWNIGIKTAAAQNMVAVGFIEKMLGKYVTWGEWFIAAAPFAAAMSVAAYFIMIKVMPPEVNEIPGGKDALRGELLKLGPMKAEEKRLLVISLAALFLWATEKSLQPLDASTTTILAVAAMFLPGIGVMNWKQAQERIPWGTIVLFGVGISLGSTLLKTNAATWLSNSIFGAFGVASASSFAIMAIIAAFTTLIHLGFASATSLSSALIPIIITLLTGMNRPDINAFGITLIIQYVISFGFILPVNAPQNMVAYGTGTFEAKDFIKVGVPLTVIAYLLVLLFGATYWKFLGMV